MTQSLWKPLRLTALALTLAACSSSPRALFAQDTPAPAAAASARALGTVKSIEGSTITLTADKTSATVTVHADAPARFLLLAPGSTDLKTATASDLSSVAVGDRVLVAGKPGSSAAEINAARVVIMKSGDIAQRNEQLQADWQKRGSGGIVSAVDAGTGTITVKSGSRTVALKTSPATQFRRYNNGSVKYADTRKGTLSDIAVGDQLRVRGDRSEDGSSITADEIVSGTFSNIAGTIVSVDSTANTIVVKDLAAKKNVTVAITPGTDLRTIPAEFATRLAMRARAGAGGPQTATNGPQATTNAPQNGGENGAHRTGPAGAAGGPGAGAGRPDLASMIARLPTQTVADLKPGQALMIVGEAASPTAPVSAITVLSGVEPILAAAPAGSNAAMTLSPWNLGAGGGGGADMGGGGIQ